MSYYDVEPETRAGKIGQQIYMKALAGRRGFREDQLDMTGDEDIEIWEEIFEDIGTRAIAAVAEIAET